MIPLSKILKDMADDCMVPPKVFVSIWENILRVLQQKKITEVHKEQ